MATEVDLQKLVVQLEASFTKYDRAWSKAMGVTDGNVKRVQQRFDAMAKSIDSAGANTSRALSPIAGQTGNIAAQFQDIAVQLQGGQSPFLIAMQQGTQLSAVLSQAKSPIAALSAAFLQMVNPISLATIAAIALGGAAVQYLGTLLGEGKSATDVIKEQNDVIRRVAENWGEAVPALKAYVDQLDRAAEQQDVDQAYSGAMSQQFMGLKSQLGDLRAEFGAARVDLAAFGASAGEIDDLQAAFDTLRARIESNSPATEELEQLQALLSQTVGAESIPALVALTGVLDRLAPSLAKASDETQRLAAERAALRNADAQVDAFTANRDFIAEQERINGLTRDQLDLENEIARVKSEAERDDTLVSDAQALQIAQDRLAADERRSEIASSAKSSASDTQRERDAVLELIQELEHEYNLLGMTEQQKTIANALRRAGAAATEEERQAIIGLVAATEGERLRIEEVQEAYSEMGRVGEAAVRGIVDALADGKIEASELGDILSSIGSQLLNAGLSSIFGSGGLFNFGGPRAAGGPVQSGQTYLVGEKGPELFAPKTSGMIVPNDRMGGSMSFPFAPVITMPGADSSAVDRMAGVLAKQSAEFEGRVKQIVRTQGRKWK